MCKWRSCCAGRMEKHSRNQVCGAVLLVAAKAPLIAREVNVHVSDPTPSCICVRGCAHEQSELPSVWCGDLHPAHTPAWLAGKHRTRSVGAVIALHSLPSH